MILLKAWECGKSYHVGLENLRTTFEEFDHEFGDLSSWLVRFENEMNQLDSFKDLNLTKVMIFKQSNQIRCTQQYQLYYHLSLLLSSSACMFMIDHMHRTI